MKSLFLSLVSVASLWSAVLVDAADSPGGRDLCALFPCSDPKMTCESTGLRIKCYDPLVKCAAMVCPQPVLPAIQCKLGTIIKQEGTCCNQRFTVFCEPGTTPTSSTSSAMPPTPTSSSSTTKTTSTTSTVMLTPTNGGVNNSSGSGAGSTTPAPTVTPIIAKPQLNAAGMVDVSAAVAVVVPALMGALF